MTSLLQALLRCCFSVIITFVCMAVTHAQEVSLPLIPYPRQVIQEKGDFTFTPATIVSGDKIFSNETALLADLFTAGFGKALVIGPDKKSQVRLKLNRSIREAGGYQLTISPKAVVLEAATGEGMFMAVQTLRQLLPSSVEKERVPASRLSVPAVFIKDHPLFPWRGTHLDVSRHFFSLDYLKRHLDLMALYKFNKFHLHLTDDQGWRMEIKKYPALTEEGAWRQLNNQDSVCLERAKDDPDFVIDPRFFREKNGRKVYGGFYTQAELKELVAYAAARHIEIVPEIDMPGHMMAAINSYPYLSCDSTSTFGKFFSTPVCPCNPATLDFAKDIFSEVMEVFPSPYIHIGGDEVERSHWERSPACQAIMQREGMKSSADLQAWFINSMEEFLRKKGRVLIGWDEILDGGVNASAAVMYWRTWAPDAPAEALRNGNKVIMSPDNPFYFSLQPDKNSLPAVYNYPVIPASVPADKKNGIIGGQANLWSEYVPTERRADYLYMPSMTALAENLWGTNKDYSSYLKRLASHFPRLDVLNVAYRIPDLPLLNSYVFTDTILLDIKPPLPDLEIRYTTDGSLPVSTSPLLGKPVLRSSQQFRMAAFKPDGRRGDVVDVSYRKTSLAIPVQQAGLSHGLTAIWYKKAFDSTSLIKGLPDGSFAVSGVGVPDSAEAASFTLQFRGYIRVPDAGIYTFYLTSDDAAVLKVAQREVVNNDGMHAPKEKNGQVALEKGLQLFALDFIEGGGGYTLKLLYSRNGSQPEAIPADWFFH